MDGDEAGGRFRAPEGGTARGGTGRAAHRRSGGRRRRLVLAASAIILLVAAVGVVTVGRLGAGPEAAADAYLRALEEGRFGDAAAQAAPAAGDPLLLTDEIGAATTNRLTGHTIADADVDGDRAQVTVRVDQDRTSAEVVLDLVREPGPRGLRGTWRVDAPAHDMLRIHVDQTLTGLVVNGVAVPLDPSTLETVVDEETGREAALLPVPPGDYEVGAERTPLGQHQSPVPARIQVPAAWTGAELPAAPAWELSPEGHEAVREQISTQLGLCADMPVPIESCPFTSPDGRAGTWELVAEPEISIAREDDRIYHVRSAPGAGLARFTPSDGGDPESVDVPFTIDGVLEWDETGRMTAVPNESVDG